MEDVFQFGGREARCAFWKDWRAQLYEITHIIASFYEFFYSDYKILGISAQFGCITAQLYEINRVLATPPFSLYYDFRPPGDAGHTSKIYRNNDMLTMTSLQQ